ncbi:hypothetical protein MXB_1558 [Myxobolus squamalis]|nr:hypothetical protein MXB_1558 [Myxobolus squamalis]
MLIWTSDEGLAVLRHQVQYLWTARSVAFLQHCTMHYNTGIGRSISTVCALCVGASDRQIRIFLLQFTHNMFILLKYIWIPRGSIVDFEIGLLNYVKYKFTESIITGCYFHFQ